MKLKTKSLLMRIKKSLVYEKDLSQSEKDRVKQLVELGLVRAACGCWSGEKTYEAVENPTIGHLQ